MRDVLRESVREQFDPSYTSAGRGGEIAKSTSTSARRDASNLKFAEHTAIACRSHAEVAGIAGRSDVFGKG